MDGCANRARTRFGALCEKHYYRRRRHGHTDDPVYGKLSLSSEGYLIAYITGHPLSTKAGLVYHHRAVLYAEFGDGEQSCHWCKRHVAWKGLGISKLYVDHLDTVKTNNDPANLVPSCARCNGARASFVTWIAQHADDPYLTALFDHAKRAAAADELSDASPPGSKV